jgi:hypothetical protein
MTAPDEPYTACGLQIGDGFTMPREAVPVSVIVVVKALSENGDVAYYTGASPELTTVEALGMAGYADAICRAALVTRHTGEDDDT